MRKHFKGFWLPCDQYTNPISVTDEMIAQAEKKLNFKLPRSYIELIKTKNGGIPVNSCFSTTVPTSWAKNHIAIEKIRGLGGEEGIDSEDVRSIDEDWGYPIHLGFVICDWPSAGHDAVMLDYSQCGRNGEPRVIHVDVENPDHPKVTILSKDFITFINGLVNCQEFED
jgi:SMI1-KNR4 cell-wall